MIDRKNVRTVLGMFEIIKRFLTDEAFLIAVYIFMKYDNEFFEKSD